MLERWFLRVIVYSLGLLRWTLGRHSRSYSLLTIAPLQPLLEAVGRLRAREVFLKARDECPAYRAFLAEHGQASAGGRRWAALPVTTKDNYVKRWSIEERCYGGALSGHGQVIDESSGSSGLPNNWVRSAGERGDVKRLLQISYDLMYGDHHRILLNCFALGPWATGMNVSMSLADVGVLKSIGPDAKKLENTLRVFGPRYRYLVFAYPPFAKAFIDATELDLTAYPLDLVVGGEGISESLRAYLRRSFTSVLSSYGASDLEINLAIETPWTVALRARCAADPALCRDLFGRDAPPMIFQYNPLDFHIETLANGELAFTVCRMNGAAPKIRYNLKDVGGTESYRALALRLAAHGIDARTLAQAHGHFAVLHVFGRSDLTVAFYGAKLYPADVESVILGEPRLASRVRSFQFSSYEDSAVNRRLAISLERTPVAFATAFEPGDLERLFYAGLAACNQDFREVTRMFTADAIEVHWFAAGTGPFEGADNRVKSQYIAGS